MTELELKFHVPHVQRAGLLKALGNRKLERVALVAHYVDTADGLLARHHFALRLRREGAQWVQTLKGPGPDPVERQEHNVESGTEATRSNAPTIDPGRHRGTPVGQRLLALLKAHGHPTLTEVYATDVVRIRRLLHTHEAAIEWALDEGTVRAQSSVGAISELELEFKGGQRSGVYTTALGWLGRHGLWLDTISKSERGQLLASGRTYRPPEHATVPEWTRKSVRRLDGQSLLRKLLSSCLGQILPNAAEIARGSVEAEHIHQLRVGLRRLRAVVREMTPYAGALAPEWEAPVGEVFAVLGSVRDLQVFQASLAPELRAAGAPIAEWTPTADDVPSESLGNIVRAPAFQTTLVQLLAFSDEAAADGTTPAGGDQPLDRLCKRLSRLQRRIARDAAGFELLDFAAQHRVRKRLKRLRYVAAFVAPLYPSSDVKAWLKVVKPAQAALGRHIDLLTAANRFEGVAAAEPEAWFAAGWLRREARESARTSQKCLRRLERAQVFW
jgi:triphosphatase